MLLLNLDAKFALEPLDPCVDFTKFLRQEEMLTALLFLAKLFKRTLFFRPILCSANTEDVNHDRKKKIILCYAST